MSKIWFSDFFWEVVWLCLLVRGWYFEQFKDGSKNFFVFLVLEVNKFFRRNMLKGSYYFDFFIDVLNKVVLDFMFFDFNFDEEDIGSSRKEEEIKNDLVMDIEEFDDDDDDFL